jgi:hypothetical protein
LHDGDTVWDCSFTGSVNISRSLEKASVWRPGVPKMEITAQPDGRVKGNLGIGLKLVAAENEFLCWKGGKPVEARVEIKKSDGDVVHTGQATPDKFTFG